VDPALLVVPFCLGFAVAFPAWGRVADRFGPRAVVRVALLVLAGAGLLVALAGGETGLVVGRALQGLAAAGVPPAVQAELARGAHESRAGRALSGMMLMVAVATLAGPAVAHAAAGLTGYVPTALLLGSVLPLALAAGIPAARAPKAESVTASGPDAALEPGDRRGVLAGWAVSALVLAGHWTVLTRLDEALGPHGLGAPAALVGAASLAGVLGLPLVVLAARASDRRGPRAPMVATLVAGAVGFLLAARASDAAMFVIASGLGLVLYWAYLPVVAVQVQRSASAAGRGRAAGGLYASMWMAAALGGAAASLAPSWRTVLVGAGISWTLAALVAWRSFLAHPAQASSPAWAPSPQPSLR
jgi:MFS family permease